MYAEFEAKFEHFPDQKFIFSTYNLFPIYREYNGLRITEIKGEMILNTYLASYYLEIASFTSIDTQETRNSHKE